MAQKKVVRLRKKKNKLRRWSVPVLVILFASGYLFYKNLPINEVAAEWGDHTKNNTTLVKLPEDDAVHDYLTEWWYYNGILEAADGNEYSFHYTVFMQEALTKQSVIHASFVDHKTNQHFSYQRRIGGDLSQPTENGFNFSSGDWSMKGSSGNDVLQGKTNQFSFDLALKATKPVVFQGGNGLLDFQEAGTSYYYTRPRLATTGTAGITGKVKPVKGVVWFDHQWGDFRTTVFGWEWFAIQLDNGADIMLYNSIFKKSGKKLLSGTYTMDGKTTVLHSSDVVLSPTKTWTSKVSQTEYPVHWSIKIPKLKLELNTKPKRMESEFDARKTTYGLYWEGAIEVTGSFTGQGFLEVHPVKSGLE